MLQSLTVTLRLHTFTRSAAGLCVSSLLVALSRTLVRAKVLLLVRDQK